MSKLFSALSVVFSILLIATPVKANYLQYPYAANNTQKPASNKTKYSNQFYIGIGIAKSLLASDGLKADYANQSDGMDGPRLVSTI
ncbi:MAG: hypothetical protein LBF37_03140 [Rickettsiales bacterium]|jgi:hypothetical protein|nr:hypothetical protein [Rickettsiales bacterium]